MPEKNIRLFLCSSSCATALLFSFGCAAATLSAQTAPCPRQLNGSSLKPFEVGLAIDAAFERSDSTTLLCLLRSHPTPRLASRLLLSAATEDERSASISAALLEGGADANAVDDSGEPVLYLAAHHGRTALVNQLLGAGARTETLDRFGETALYAAIDNHHEETALALVARGASLRAPDGAPAIDPVFAAVSAGMTTLFEAMWRRHAPLSTAGSNGEPNLYYGYALQGHGPVADLYGWTVVLAADAAEAGGRAKPATSPPALPVESVESAWRNGRPALAAAVLSAHLRRDLTHQSVLDATVAAQLRAWTRLLDVHHLTRSGGSPLLSADNATLGAETLRLVPILETRIGEAQRAIAPDDPALVPALGAMAAAAEYIDFVETRLRPDQGPFQFSYGVDRDILEGIVARAANTPMAANDAFWARLQVPLHEISIDDGRREARSLYDGAVRDFGQADERTQIAAVVLAERISGLGTGASVQDLNEGLGLRLGAISYFEHALGATHPLTWWAARDSCRLAQTLDGRMLRCAPGAAVLAAATTRWIGPAAPVTADALFLVAESEADSGRARLDRSLARAAFERLSASDQKELDQRYGVSEQGQAFRQWHDEYEAATYAGDTTRLAAVLTSPFIDGYNRTWPVYQAQKRGHGEAVRWLLTRSPRPLSHEDLNQVAYSAVVDGDAPLLALALEAGADSNAVVPDGSGDTLIMVAVTFGRAPLVAALVHAGADPQRANARGQSALTRAADRHQTASVAALLGAGVDLQGADRSGIGSVVASTSHFEPAAFLAQLALLRSGGFDLQGPGGNDARSGPLEGPDAAPERGAPAHADNQAETLLHTALAQVESLERAGAIDEAYGRLSELLGEIDRRGLYADATARRAYALAGELLVPARATAALFPGRRESAAAVFGAESEIASQAFEHAYLWLSVHRGVDDPALSDLLEDIFLTCPRGASEGRCFHARWGESRWKWLYESLVARRGALDPTTLRVYVEYWDESNRAGHGEERTRKAVSELGAQTSKARAAKLDPDTVARLEIEWAIGITKLRDPDPRLESSARLRLAAAERYAQLNPNDQRILWSLGSMLPDPSAPGALRGYELAAPLLTRYSGRDHARTIEVRRGLAAAIAANAGLSEVSGQDLARLLPELEANVEQECNTVAPDWSQAAHDFSNLLSVYGVVLQSEPSVLAALSSTQRRLLPKIDRGIDLLNLNAGLEARLALAHVLSQLGQLDAALALEERSLEALRNQNPDRPFVPPAASDGGNWATIVSLDSTAATFETLGRQRDADFVRAIQRTWGLRLADPSAWERLDLASTDPELLSALDHVGLARSFTRAAYAKLRDAALTADDGSLPRTLERYTYYTQKSGAKEDARAALDLYRIVAMREGATGALRLSALDARAASLEGATTRAIAQWQDQVAKLSTPEAALSQNEVTETYGELVGVLEQSGQYDAAYETQARLTALLVRGGGPTEPGALNAQDHLIQLARVSGRKDETLVAYEHLIAAIETSRASGDLPPDYRQSFFAHWVPRYRAYMAELAARGDLGQAFHIAELSKARTLLESTALRRANQDTALAPSEKERLEEFERRIALANEQIAHLTESGSARLAREADRDRVVREYGTYRRELAAHHPKYAQLADVELISAEAIERELGPDEALISYFLDQDRLSAFVVHQGSLRYVSGPTPAHFSDTIEALRLVLASVRGLATLSRSDGTPLYLYHRPDGSFVVAATTPPGAELMRETGPLVDALSQALVAPIKPLAGDANRWIIAPDAGLALLPFEVLSDGAGELVRQHDVSYVQSASMLHLLRKRGREHQTLTQRHDLLAVGAAEYSAATNTDLAGGAAPVTRPDGDPVAALEAVRLNRGPATALGLLGVHWDNLPGSREELEMLERLYGNAATMQVLAGPEATEERLREINASGQLRLFRILHFSTHGYLSPEDPALSAIVLGQRNLAPGTDGYITTSKWPSYDLESDLTVLSACETGLGRITPGEGVMGVPFALFVAGNQDTVLTLWSILDDSAAKFMASFYGRLHQGMDPEHALNETKREFLNSGLSSPVHWAAFLYYGA